MPTKIAINGFGRIGRCIVRAMAERDVKDLELVAINDLTDAKTLAHLYNYDSVHGRADAPGAARSRAPSTSATCKTSRSSPRRTRPSSRGRSSASTSSSSARGSSPTRRRRRRTSRPARRRSSSARPRRGTTLTIVLGVNTEVVRPGEAHVISSGSCTTNCLAPVAKVLLDNFGIERGLMTTVHSYTNDQAVLDIPHRKGDLRRARAAALNMIPSSHRRGQGAEPRSSRRSRASSTARRSACPTMDVSIVDLTFETEKPVTKDAIHAAMKAAAEGPMKGILEYVEEPLVSGDFIGDPHSSIFDATMTQVLGDQFAKVFSWYDNEWGFSNRMVELAQLVASKL